MLSDVEISAQALDSEQFVRQVFFKEDWEL